MLSSLSLHCWSIWKKYVWIKRGWSPNWQFDVYTQNTEPLYDPFYNAVWQIERYCVSDHRWHVTNPLPSYLNFFLMRRWIIPENCLKKEGNWSLGCNNSMLRSVFPFLQENYLYTFLGVALPHCRQWLHCHLSTLSFLAHWQQWSRPSPWNQ